MQLAETLLELTEQRRQMLMQSAGNAAQNIHLQQLQQQSELALLHCAGADERLVLAQQQLHAHIEQLNAAMVQLQCLLASR